MRRPRLLLRACPPVLLMSVLLISCSPGGHTVTAPEAATAMQTLSGAVNLVFNSQSLWTQVGSDVSWSAPGLSMSGTVSTAGPLSTYTLAVACSGYYDVATGYTVSGTADTSLVVTTTTGAVSGTVTGSFTFAGGPVTKATWNLTVTGTGPGSLPSFSGTVTCDDISFDAGTISLDRTTQANAALQAVFFGIGAVMGSQSSWIPGAGNDVSYDALGVSMTGTKVSGATTTDYTLAITFASYADSQFGYTLNGTVNFVLAGEDPNLITGGTVTGTVTLSASPVAGLTFNVTNIVGVSGVSMSFEGTVTADGTVFDAKTLVPG
jgi:hypothetical protein